MEIAMTVERIKNLAKSKGFKIKYICSQIGVGDNYLNDCKNKNLEIPADRLKSLAILLDTSVEYLLGETNDSDFDISKVGLETLPYEPRGVRPVYGKASAGLGVLAQQDNLGYEPVSPMYDNDSCFWLKVSGDSMSPVIADGDLVLVEKDVPIESDTVMVVILDDDAGFVKKVSINDDTVVLRSYNPIYPPMIFGGSEIGRLRFVGRVRELKRVF